MQKLSRRALLVVAGMLGGAAIALLVYRFAILGLLWKGGAKHVLTALAIGMAIGAQAIVKQHDGPKLVPLAIGGTVGAAVAFAALYVVFPTLGNVRLEPRDFPGFTISLPPGDDDGAPLDYTAGKVVLRDVAGTNSALSVQWEPGEPSREDLELVAKGLTHQFGGIRPATLLRVRGPGKTEVETAIITTDKGDMRLSFVGCGKRRIMVLSMGDDGIESLHARVLPTIVCRPVDALEPSEDGVVNIHVELPGWHASERGPSLVTVTDGTSYLTLRQLAPGKPQDLTVIIPTLFHTRGTMVVETPPIDDRYRLSGTLDGEAVVGWVRELVCPRGNVLQLLFAPDRATADAVATLTANARCLRTGETAPAWPDAPAPAAE